jgi:hypothetical protein
MALVKQTLILSLIGQTLITLAGLLALMVTLKPQDQILYTINAIETGVQFVEALFYVWFAFFFTKNMTRTDITRYRYFDWVFTTPAMLLTVAVFFVYNAMKDQGKSLTSMSEFLKFYGMDFYLIALYNFLMLAFGYLYEINILSLLTSNTIGFLFFGLSFYKLYELAILSKSNLAIFWIMFSIWGLYGVAATFSNIPKNIMYNTLDIFSKNFYGLYLSYVVWIMRV